MLNFPRDVKDRSVEHPNRYQLVPVPGEPDIYDLIEVPGEITEEGTFINKVYLQPIEDAIQDLHSNTEEHKGKTDNPHTVTKEQVGLSNVTNDAQVPLAGGTMTGALIPITGGDLGTGQARQIIFATSKPVSLPNGVLCVVYD